MAQTCIPLEVRGSTDRLEDIIGQVTDPRTLIRRCRMVLSGKRLKATGLRAVRSNPIATRDGVKPEVYHAYRKGLPSACADVVLVRLTDGITAVPLIKRKAPPFAGCWWIMGGAIFSHRPIRQFLLWKVALETSITEEEDIDKWAQQHKLKDDDVSWKGIHIIGWLGTARTAASDMQGTGRVCDTINQCYLGLVTQEHRFFPDQDHTDIAWRTTVKPGDCNHWYPEWAAGKALRIVQAAYEQHASQRRLGNERSLGSVTSLANDALRGKL
ncbi:MAG TPA: hypothetical protein VJC16_07900 [Candidatus Nanoarchaeia archaeon]|nr:hypothetical protein [Candidatus Nanoarchaeia archaeon]